MPRFDMRPSGSLQQDMHAASLDKQPAGISVHILRAGEYEEAGVNQFNSTSLVSVGCLAKVLTATLVAIAQADGTMRLDASVRDFLSSDVLGAIQIGHLLNHTSGLDCSSITSLPRRDGGFIDTSALLCALHGCAPLAEPGEVFDYGNIGSWLVAAILEAIYGKPYAELLNDLLLIPFGITQCDDSKPASICPSWGHALRLSAQDLVKLALLHMHGDPTRPELAPSLAALRSQFGFTSSPTESYRRVFPGWFDFGESYGHMGYSENTAAVVRFLPHENAVICITAAHAKLANATLGILFHRVLPDLGRLHGPRVLSTDEWAGANRDVYMGTFENARYRLCVDTAGNGALRAKIFRQGTDTVVPNAEPYIKRYFRAMDNDTFFPLEPEPLVCPRLQFSHPQRNALFRYASTGRYVFSRVA